MDAEMIVLAVRWNKTASRDVQERKERTVESADVRAEQRLVECRERSQ
jgi:hypothetical protein